MREDPEFIEEIKANSHDLIQDVLTEAEKELHIVIAVGYHTYTSEMIVLAKPSFNPHLYVTWRYNRIGKFYLGHYYKSLEEAFGGFAKRLTS